MLQWYGSGKLKTIMNLQREQLLGTWLLQRWQVEYSDARPSSYPFGTDAIGVLIYAPDGWMSATMALRQRAPLSSASAVQANLSSRARVMLEMLSYQGRWRLEGNCICHDIVLSLNPVLIGATQQREAQLHEAALHLVAREADAAGKQRLHRIVWVRDAAPLKPVSE